MVKEIKIFLDSNVILSAFLSEKGAPRLILDIVSLQLEFLKAATGKFNLMEIEHNLLKKFPKIFPIYNEYFPKLNFEIIPFPEKEQVQQVDKIIHPKDAPVLASALNWNANILITGNIKDFSAYSKIESPRLRIITPAEFIDHTLPEIMDRQYVTSRRRFEGLEYEI